MESKDDNGWLYFMPNESKCDGNDSESNKAILQQVQGEGGNGSASFRVGRQKLDCCFCLEVTNTCWFNGIVAAFGKTICCLVVVPINFV